MSFSSPEASQDDRTPDQIWEDRKPNMLAAANDMGVLRTHDARNLNLPVTEFLETLNTEGSVSAEKQVPDDVMYAGHVAAEQQVQAEQVVTHA
jgi:hypothetical protein